MTISFECFDEHNLDPVYQIETAAQSHPMSNKVMLSCLGKRYFNSAIYLDGELAGFYIGEFVLDESSLIEICVAPVFQGKGLGQQLLQHYVEQAKHKGAMSCWLEVRQSNTSARKLYQALDFNEVDCRVNYYPTAKGHEDAIIMCLYVM